MPRSRLAPPVASLAAWLLGVPAMARDDAMAHLRRGQELQQAGRAAEASAEYEAALQQQPDLIEAQVRLGLLLLELGPRERGLSLLDAAAPHIGAPVLAACGASLLRAGLLADAQRYLERAARLDAGLPSVDLLLGQAYSARGDHVRAIERLTRAAEREPAAPQPRYLLGITYSLMGEKQQAVAELERAAALGPENAALHYYLGLSQLDLGRYPEAVDVLIRAAELDPTDRDTTVNLAWALLGLGRPQAASERLAALLLRQPDDAVAAFLLGESRRRAGDVEGAIAAYGRALELDGWMLDALFSRGTLFYLRQERERARADYERLLALDPRHPGGRYQMGKLLLDEGRDLEAVTQLEKSVEAEPTNKPAHYQLARAYRRLGRAEDARREAAVFRSLKAEAAEASSGRLDPLPRRPTGR